MRTELDVPFSHKEEAKALGAKWDRTKKIWYVPSGVNPEPFAEWLPGVDRSDPSAPYIYLVLGKRECWKCHKETSVAAFGIPYRTDNDESIAIAHAPNEAGHIAIDTPNANALAIDRVRAEKVKVTEAIQETIDCVREIRATNQEAHYLEGLNAVIDAEERETTKGELANGLLVNSAFAILRLGIATTLVTGAAMVASGKVDFLVMFAFLLMVSRIYAPFDQALMLVSELFAAESSAKRMRSIMEEPVARGSEKFEPAGHDVVFDHVAFGYGAGEDGRAGEKVLTDVSFTAKEGEVTALVGPSGSGKSTVSRLAARFWDATAGKVTVGGVDVATVDPEVLLRDYAIVFQDVLLFDDTVMGNIRLGRRDATDEEVLAAARAANCDEFVSRMPQGYDTMIGENGSKLSGGERQRISIARALLKDAPIVLLDEATASLDVENETVVQQALSRLLAGKTVIVIAHRMRTVENADKIVVLKDGVVAEQGTPAQLKAAGGEFARMVALQKEAAAWQL